VKRVLLSAAYVCGCLPMDHVLEMMAIEIEVPEELTTAILRE
jgi:hypothetical protein